MRLALDDAIVASKILRFVSRMKRYLPFIIVVGVALVTFGSGTMLYRAKRPQVKNIPESQSVSARSDVRRTFEATLTLRLRWKSSAISSARRADNSPGLLRNC